MKLVVIVGIPGVGKTTVLNLTKKRLEEEGYVVKVVNFGDFMLDMLVSKGLVKSRDEIRRLPLKIQREAQAEAGRRIREFFEREAGEEEEKFIGFVDTHALIKTSSGIWPGLPLHVIRELMPDTIIVVEADPEEIVARQLRDTTRYRRDLARVDLVRELLALNRSFAIASAVLSGASVNFILNREGKAEEAAGTLANIIKNL